MEIVESLWGFALINLFTCWIDGELKCKKNKQTNITIFIFLRICIRIEISYFKWYESMHPLTYVFCLAFYVIGIFGFWTYTLLLHVKQNALFSIM